MSNTATALNMEALVTEVRRIAAENPDFRYKDHLDGGDKCFYNETEDGKPACIMGQALASLGYPVDPMYEQKGVDFVLSHQFHMFSGGWAVREWLASVQSNQDRGSTWAEAIEAADRMYGHV